MTLRRYAPLALVALAVGCTEVKQEKPASTLVYATFNPDTATLPTPNDLALQKTPLLPASAQKELLQAFVDAGGFPADQEVAISIPFHALTFNSATNLYEPAATAPIVDPATVTTSTVAVYKLANNAAPVRVTVTAETDPLDSKVLKIRKAAGANGRRWDPGARYVVAVRGGANGVKTTTGLAVNADQVISLVIPNKDMTLKENQPPGGLDPVTAATLDGVRKLLWNPVPWCNVTGTGWSPVLSPTVAGACATPGVYVQPAASAFSAISSVFPATEVAAIATFEIAPSAGTYALLDAGSGQAPLPMDLLRNPVTGKVVNNPAFGSAAPGLASLGGFSTTAMFLAPVSFPIDAGTVPGKVFLYKKTGATWAVVQDLKTTLLAPPNYVSQPTPIVTKQGDDVVTGVPCPAANGCSLLVGLQPAYPVETAPGSFVYLPPLAADSDYAVIVTRGVHDILGGELKRSTVAKIILEEIGTSTTWIPEGTGPCTAPAPAGCSLLSGIDPVTANALQTMRGALAPAITQFETDTGLTKDADVVLAYTVHTQPTVTATSALLAFAGSPATQGFTLHDAATVASDYGFPAANLPGAAFSTFADVKFQTKNLLLESQNAGIADPAHPYTEEVTALVAVPTAAAVTALGNTCAATATPCAPLVVFRHGITRAKGDMLGVAATLAASGFVVASFDAEKHGDRTLCTSDTQCIPGVSTCNFTRFPLLRTPADTTPVGVCETAAGARAYLDYRLDCAVSPPDATCISTSGKGIPFASGNLFVSGNLFRTRDSLRQDVIDTASLVGALTEGSATGNFAEQVATYGFGIDPDRVYVVGQSLGSIMGSLSVAVNSEIDRAVFNVPGATVTDIFASPDSGFHGTLIALLATFDPPILEGTSGYLQFVQLAKWILDPADPANFGATAAGRIGANEMLTQIALCDGTIPNPQNRFFAAMMGETVPAPGDAGTGYVQWFINGASGAVCPDDAVTHGFLLSPTPLTTAAQADVANFLATGSAQATTVRP